MWVGNVHEVRVAALIPVPLLGQPIDPGWRSVGHFWHFSIAHITCSINWPSFCSSSERKSQDFPQKEGLLFSFSCSRYTLVSSVVVKCTARSVRKGKLVCDRPHSWARVWAGSGGHLLTKQLGESTATARTHRTSRYHHILQFTIFKSPLECSIS